MIHRTTNPSQKPASRRAITNALGATPSTIDASRFTTTPALSTRTLTTSSTGSSKSKLNVPPVTRSSQLNTVLASTSAPWRKSLHGSNPHRKIKWLLMKARLWCSSRWWRRIRWGKSSYLTTLRRNWRLVKSPDLVLALYTIGTS
jgi:hypothetical protein